MSNKALTKMTVPSTFLNIHIPDNVVQKEQQRHRVGGGNTVTQSFIRAVLSGPQRSLIYCLFVLPASGEGRPFITEVCAAGTKVKDGQSRVRAQAFFNHEYIVNNLM